MARPGLSSCGNAARGSRRQRVHRPKAASLQLPRPRARPVGLALPLATASGTGSHAFNLWAPAAGGASAQQVQYRCPGATVVWVNENSHMYHFPGTRDYGNTKRGAYMCEPDAEAAGDRAAKNERRRCWRTSHKRRFPAYCWTESWARASPACPSSGPWIRGNC